jgi:hypothetical protein
LLEAFSDEDFTIFCYDHFYPVHQKFAEGMTFHQKVQLLIEHCQRNDLFGLLLAYVKDLNPNKYAEYDSLLQIKASSSLTEQSVNSFSRFLLSFDYSDYPTEHDWYLEDETTQPLPEFRPYQDEIVGKAIKIEKEAWYGLDYDVASSAPQAKRGTVIEFLVKLEDQKESLIYAEVYIQSRDGSEPKLPWYNFRDGDGPPYRPNREIENEWIVPIKPKYLGRKWALFKIDLDKVIKESYGEDGWKFGELTRFRLRGNLSIAGISVEK